MEIVSGQNLQLSGNEFAIELVCTKGGAFNGEIDTSAFLLTQHEKVHGDGGFIFYNQPESLDGAVIFTKTETGGNFTVNTDMLDPLIEKIAFTLAINGSSTITHLSQLKLSIFGQVTYFVPLIDRSEKAVIVGHLYRHNGIWKFKGLGQGFNGGLVPLATH
ncbi:MAG: TerD family protein, partial [Vibrionaceae bacterium]